MMEMAKIRTATLRDAERIYALVSRNSDMLVPRSLGNIVESIDRFVIAEAEGEMVGCASRVCQLKIPKSRSRPSPRAFFACGLHNNYVVTQNGFTADFNSLMSPFV